MPSACNRLSWSRTLSLSGGAYRFYIEDESGRQVQREFAGTESKSETEALLRKAMEDYEAKKFVSHEQYLKLTDYLKGKDNPAQLPVQIAYYTGLRIDEVCGLTWQDINLDEQ